MNDTPEPRSLRHQLNVYVPSAPCLGFGFWFAWNLVAFSGSVWNTQDDSTLLISYLFIFHLLASVATLLIFALGKDSFHHLVMSRRYLAAGAVVGCAGTLAMILGASAQLSSVTLFVVGAVLAGVGTSFLLIRSFTIFSLVTPRKSFIAISLCAFFAIATYFFIEAYSLVLSATLFCLLPVLSALFLGLKEYSSHDLRLIGTTTRLPHRFSSLLLAIFAYSLCQEITKGYMLATLTASEAVLCMRYVMLALVVLMVLFVMLAVMFPPDFSMGRVFYPLALGFILPQLAVPFLDMVPVFGAAGIDFAGYGFDLFVWSICAYLAFQMQGNAIKILGLCTAALSAGLALGSTASLLIAGAQLTTAQFLPINFVLVLICILVTVFVFPEKRLSELLLPVQEDADEAVTVQTQKALWRQAAQEVALRGGLTTRETEVFVRVAKGLTAQEVADELVVSVHTVRAHIRNIHSKLEVSTRADITRLIEEERDTPRG